MTSNPRRKETILAIVGVTAEVTVAAVELIVHRNDLGTFFRSFSASVLWLVGVNLLLTVSVIWLLAAGRETGILPEATHTIAPRVVRLHTF